MSLSIDTCDGYSVDSPVSSITSNGCYSDVLFTGDMGGKVNVIDIERKETTHSFDPFVICPSYYSQYNITSDPVCPSSFLLIRSILLQFTPLNH